MSDRVGSCNVQGIEHLKSENKDGFFIVVTQDGCPHCTKMKDVLKETVQEKKPILEASLQDEDCKGLAGELKVGVTPTIFYYKGDQHVRINPDDNTWDQIRQKVRELSQ